MKRIDDKDKYKGMSLRELCNRIREVKSMDEEPNRCKDCEHWKEKKNLRWGVRIGHCPLFCTVTDALSYCTGTDFKQKETKNEM